MVKPRDIAGKAEEEPKSDALGSDALTTKPTGR